MVVSYADTGQQTTHTMYIHSGYEGSSKATPIWKSASDNYISAWFDITPYKVSVTDFKVAARKAIPAHQGLGIIVHKEINRTLVEIIFASLEDRANHCSQGIVMDGCTIYGWPSLKASGSSLTRVRLTKIPLRTEQFLKTEIQKTLEKHGKVLEFGIYRTAGWFEGEGYAIFLAESSTKKIELPRVFLAPGPWLFFAKWSQMPVHCRYCHELGHTLLKCPPPSHPSRP
jgi:hypothetical protein